MRIVQVIACYLLIIVSALMAQEKAAPYLKKAELPKYPILARQARIDGAVKISFEVAEDGTVSEVQAISGHPMLKPAALENVQSWRFGFSGGVGSKQRQETEFVFRLSGKDVEKNPRLTVSLESFRRVEITSDVLVIPDSPNVVR
jgi:TonB family protein